MVRNLNRSSVAILAPALAVPLLPGVAGAQLEEVIVTARKRDETAMEVPLSIALVSGDKIDNYVLNSAVNLTAMQPGVHLSDDALSDNITLRGIGSGGNQGFEKSTATYMDGAYVARGFWLKSGLFDLDALEILKGPQGTYFGKNAIAGAFNMQSRDPTDEFEASIGSGYEVNAQEYFLEGIVSGAVSDGFLARAAVRYTDSSGWLENVNLGDEPDKEEALARLTLVWLPSDNLEVNLKFDYSDFDRIGRAFDISTCSQFGGFAGPFAILSEGGTTLDGPLGVPLNFVAPGANGAPSQDDCTANDRTSSSYLAGVTGFRAFTPFVPGGIPVTVPADRQRNVSDFWEAFATTATINWDFSDWTLTSLTSFRTQEYEAYLSCDFTDLHICNTDRFDEHDSLQQEIRVTSPQDGRVRGVAGVFYEDGELSVLSDASVMAFFVGQRVGPGSQDSTSWSLFGEVEFDLGDQLTLALGARYSDEQKDATLDNCLGPLFSDGTCENRTDGGFPPTFFFEFPAPLSGTFSDDDFSPSATLTWQASDNAMIYGRYAEGFKAGGFDLEASTIAVFNDPGSFTYDSEEAESFEIGTKVTLLDGRMQLSAAVFDSDYTNLQVQTFGGGVSFIVQNAGEATSQGTEFELLLQATDDFLFGTSFSLLDATIDELTNGQCHPFEAPTRVVGTSRICDQSGNDQPYAPEFSANIFGNYTTTFSNGLGGRFGFDIYWSDDYQTDVVNDPNTVQDSYSLVNVNLALLDADGRWEMAIYGRNVTDELVINDNGPAPLMGDGTRFASLLQTAAYGFQFKYNFTN